MIQRLPQLILLGMIGFVFPAAAVADEAGGLHVVPDSVELQGRWDRQRLSVTMQQDRYRRDLSTAVRWTVENGDLVSISEEGVIRPRANGNTVLIGTHGEQQVRIPVTVTGMETQPRVDFERDVMPILAKGGCNSGPCHGKARGQNGFQLSLLGFDPDFDHDALTKEARGRRVFPPDPVRSLLLQKPTGQVPHGGGRRLRVDADEYDILHRWIADGGSRQVPGTPRLVGIRVWPDQVVLPREATMQLLVTAEYSDGSSRDVTHLAAYQSNESSVAAVSEQGRITAGFIMGEVAVMARYEGQFATCRVALPLPDAVPEQLYASLPSQHFVDDLVWKQLQRLGITPSEAAAEHKILRRLYIDIIGRLPSAEEARAFLEDTNPEKRAALIDRLLDSPEYAEHWANKWADLLRPNPYRVGIKAVLNYDHWIRDSFRKNKPYDQFVYELVSGTGSTFRQGNVTLFRDRRSPDELTTMVSQLFLGIRLECAKCHHHPFEVWGQKDFYSFAAYFAKVGRKGTGLSPPISGSEEFVYAGDRGTVTHPVTGEELAPAPLFGEAPELAEHEDPRETLATWMTSDQNPFFAQVMVNRVWADLMGRGLVEPVDDIRATNPASNEQLLQALGEDFRDHGYDVKQLIRRITTSYVYGLSSEPNERNVADTINHSRHYRQRIRAEVLLDSITSITGVPEQFSAMPPGSQAREIWTHRVDSVFLDTFGRPDPNQDPPCERAPEATMVQALHLMNSENLYRKIKDESGLVAKLLQAEATPEQIIDEFYLLAYSRFPTADEARVGVEYLQQENLDRKTAAQDLLWALLNTPEFIYKD